MSASILMTKADEWHRVPKHSTPQDFGHPTNVPETVPVVFGEGEKEKSSACM